MSRAFDKELKVIVNLMNMFHNNILLPLAMWRQENTEGDDMFYILYPKAQYDLKDYMRPHRRTPSLTRDFVEHLMLQIWNRADALESMHLLSRRLGLVEDSTQSTVHPEPAETPLQYAAYYHDLKHDNILVFEDGTWKISDFGTAGVTQAISGGKSIFEVTDVQLPETQCIALLISLRESTLQKDMTSGVLVVSFWKYFLQYFKIIHLSI